MTKKVQSASCQSEQNKALMGLLKKARIDQGLGMRQLGTLLGKPHSYVGKYENQERRLDVVEFIAVCVVLKQDPAALIKSVSAIAGVSRATEAA